MQYVVLLKMMSWNIRGLGRNDKRAKIKKLVSERKINVLLLQESKRSSVDVRFVKSLWPWESLQFMAVDLEGSAGGLLCVWNLDVFKIEECCSARSFILVSGTYN